MSLKTWLVVVVCSLGITAWFLLGVYAGLCVIKEITGWDIIAGLKDKDDA